MKYSTLDSYWTIFDFALVSISFTHYRKLERFVPMVRCEKVAKRCEEVEKRCKNLIQVVKNRSFYAIFYIFLSNMWKKLDIHYRNKILEKWTLFELWFDTTNNLKKTKTFKKNFQLRRHLYFRRVATRQCILCHATRRTTQKCTVVSRRKYKWRLTVYLIIIPP